MTTAQEKLVQAFAGKPLADIETYILDHQGSCLKCNKRFARGDIRSYGFSGGILIKDNPDPLWISMECTTGIWPPVYVYNKGITQQRLLGTPCRHRSPLGKILQDIQNMDAQFRRDTK